MRKSTRSDSCVNQSVADEVGAGTRHAPGCGPETRLELPEDARWQAPLPWLLDLLKLSRKSPVDLLRSVDPHFYQLQRRTEAPQLK